MKKATRKSGKSRSDEFLPVTKEDLNQELFDRNLAAFKKMMPYVAPHLENITTTHSKLVINANGEYDIDFRGNRLYGMGAEAWAKKRMKNFDNKHGISRLFIAPPDSKMLDDEANKTVFNMLKRSTDAGLSFANRPLDIHCFHCVGFGVGLAHHLPALARRTACQNLILVEPNFEFVYLSLFVFDWAKFLENISAEGRHIVMIRETNSRPIAENIRDQMRYIHPSFMDGTIFFETYPSSVMARACDILIDERDTLGIGLGFLEDEMDMVRNAFHNLNEFEGKFFNGQKDVLPFPAFIVGSGPSLDRDIDFIRENQDRALIISCGTSIRVLLNNGIQPDFHVELENVPLVADLVDALSKQFDLSNIVMLATTTVDPRVAQYFKRVVYYFRSGLASYPLFFQGHESTLTYSTPMVTNLGFSFAQEIGARNLYNFGIDLGARDPEVHHAKDTPYDSGEAVFSGTINQPVPGNFGGIVYSEMVYLWAKQTMEFAINRHSAKGIFYNSSDGIRIEGTVPKLSSTITLNPGPDKQAVVENIYEQFPDYTKSRFEKSWIEYEPRKRMTEFRDQLLKICKTGRPLKPKDQSGDKVSKATKPKRRSSAAARYPLRYLMHVVRALIPGGESPTTEIHYYRGSTFLCMAAVHYYYTRVEDGPDRKKFLEIVREEFTEQVQRIDDRVQEFYDELEPPKISQSNSSPQYSSHTQSG